MKLFGVGEVQEFTCWGQRLCFNFQPKPQLPKVKISARPPSMWIKKIQTPSHVGKKKYESPSPPGHRTSLRIFFLEMEFSRLFNACHSHCSMMMCKLIGAIINLYTVTRIDYDSQTISISLTKKQSKNPTCIVIGRDKKTGLLCATVEKMYISSLQITGQLVFDNLIRI